MPAKLYIPGPVAVSEKTLRAMAQPMIGHRSADFIALYRSLTPGLQALFGTTSSTYLATSSAWGVMEGALRNLARKKVLCCMNGAFSDKSNGDNRSTPRPCAPSWQRAATMPSRSSTMKPPAAA
jgi:aspartate aminotransferase-like enzyme